MGGGPGKGCHQLQVSLRASASLFLGINIYRFVCCLPYTLGCLPTGENRAGCALPPFPSPPGQDKGGQGKPAACGSAGENLVSGSLVAGPEVGWDGVVRGTSPSFEKEPVLVLGDSAMWTVWAE